MAASVLLNYLGESGPDDAKFVYHVEFMPGIKRRTLQCAGQVAINSKQISGNKYLKSPPGISQNSAISRINQVV
jgi:hypothetical protein